MNVLICGHYNLNNGDRALLEATYRIVHSLYQDCRITVSAYAPEDLKDNRFEVVHWALGNGLSERIMIKLSKFGFFRKVFKIMYQILCDPEYLEAVRSADIIFVSGGHHLTDLLSEQTYYRLSSNFVVPILEKKRVVLLPQSIGPAKKECIKDSIKFILKNSYSVAYRDESSKKFIESLNVKCNLQYVPDLVFSISPDKTKERDNKTIGIALYHSYTGNKKETLYPFILSNLCQIISCMIDKNYQAKIIPMDIDDDIVVKQIKNLLPDDKKEKVYLGCKYETILDLIDEFATVRFTLAYKTHSTVFSMICNTPLIAVAYHPKSIEFMDKVGLSEYAINDSQATCDNIIRLIERLENNYERIRTVELLGVENNKELIKQYIIESMS